MKIAFFSAKPYEILFFNQANIAFGFDIEYFQESLNEKSAILAKNAQIACCFVSDTLDLATLTQLSHQGIQLIALRSAGYNHVDLVACKQLGLTVVRVPNYSPFAIAEFAVGLILSLNRHIHDANRRLHQHNFSLEGLLGFDLHGKTVGIIGTGHIGTAFAHMMKGFGCQLLATDPIPNEDCKKIGVRYVDLSELLQQSDIISLHCPLNGDTHHLLNAKTLAKIKKGAMIINTGRGALIDTQALFPLLENQMIGALGLDVYEYEGPLFFQDLSNQTIEDEIFLKLQQYSQVLITPHQAFFTKEAVSKIAEVTLKNIHAFKTGSKHYFSVSA